MEDDVQSEQGVKKIKPSRLDKVPQGEQLRESLIEILYGELTYKNYLSIPKVQREADLKLDRIQALIQPMIDKARQEGIEHAEMEYNLNVLPKLIDKAVKDTRWEVGGELCCLIGNLMLEDMEAGKLLGNQLNEYMKHHLKGKHLSRGQHMKENEKYYSNH